MYLKLKAQTGDTLELMKIIKEAFTGDVEDIRIRKTEKMINWRIFIYGKFTRDQSKKIKLSSIELQDGYRGTHFT